MVTWKSRTFWVGVAAVIVGLANALFGPDDSLNTPGQVLSNLLHGTAGAEVLGGLAAIFGRAALARYLNQQQQQ